MINTTSMKKIFDSVVESLDLLRYLVSLLLIGLSLPFFLIYSLVIALAAYLMDTKIKLVIYVDEKEQKVEEIL